MEEKLLRFRNEHRSFPWLPGVAKASLQEARAGCPGAKELSTKALTWEAGVRDSWGRKVVMVLETKCLVEQMNLFSRSTPCPDSLPAARETGALQGHREQGGQGKRVASNKSPWMRDSFGWLWAQEFGLLSHSNLKTQCLLWPRCAVVGAMGGEVSCHCREGSAQHGLCPPPAWCPLSPGLGSAALSPG